MKLKDEEYLGVPRIISELSGKRVITSELITGMPINKVAELDQDERNFVGFCNMFCFFCFYILFFCYFDANKKWQNYINIMVKKL